MLTNPYMFQRKAVRSVQEFKGRSLISLEQGLGKSLVSLMYAVRNPELRPIVIVCPAYLKWNWQREALKHFGLPSEILEGRTIPKGWKPTHPIIIINYDILMGWLPALKALKPKLIIGDEIQMVSHRSSFRSKSFKRLCQGVPHVLALSGTPLLNRPVELFPILNILWPEEFPSFWSFAQRFCDPKKTIWGWDYNGSKDLDVLHKILIRCGMIRMLKKDVLKDLPQKRREVVPVELTKQGLKEYKHAERDYLDWVMKNDPAKIGKARKAEQLSRMAKLRSMVGIYKLPAVYQWIDSFLENGNGDKLCMFAVHINVVEGLNKQYQSSSVLVNGSVTGEKRQKAFDQFVRQKDTPLLFGNIKAAGTGWNGTGVSNIGFCELPWTPGEISQCESRGEGINRGTKGDATCSWFLVARGTIEEHMMDFLERKQKILNATLDGGTGKGDNLDIYTQITNMMLKEKNHDS